MDRHTQKDADNVVERTLADAGIVDPPVCIESVP